MYPQYMTSLHGDEGLLTCW